MAIEFNPSKWKRTKSLIKFDITPDIFFYLLFFSFDLFPVFLNHQCLHSILDCLQTPHISDAHRFLKSHRLNQIMDEAKKTSEILKGIKNKHRRQKVFAAIQAEKSKEKHKLRAARAKEERENPQLKEERLANNVPETLETKRVFDETIATEIEGEDEFFELFNKSQRDPKVLITTIRTPGSVPMNLQTFSWSLFLT